MRSQPPPPRQPELPPDTFTDHAPVADNGAMTVLLFDELSFSDPHSSGTVCSFADGAYTREQVAAFAKTMPPGTVACIFRLDWYGLRLIPDFTNDSHVFEEAVQTKRNSQRFSGLGFGLYDIRAAAMRDLARYLSAFPGRKNLIWFSGGITPQEASELAAATGGKAFYNTNGIKQAVAEVVATGSNYYTYSPTNNLWNGNFRKLKIKLAKNPSVYSASQAASVPLVPPLHLEYRCGYFARDTAPTSAPVSTEQSASPRKLISYSPKGDPDGRGPQKNTARVSHVLGRHHPLPNSLPGSRNARTRRSCDRDVFTPSSNERRSQSRRLLWSAPP